MTLRGRAGRTFVRVVDVPRGRSAPPPSDFMTPRECRTRARELRTAALRKAASDARDALLSAAVEYDKLAGEIEQAFPDDA